MGEYYLLLATCLRLLLLFLLIVPLLAPKSPAEKARDLIQATCDKLEELKTKSWARHIIAQYNDMMSADKKGWTMENVKYEEKYRDSICFGKNFTSYIKSESADESAPLSTVHQRVRFVKMYQKWIDTASPTHWVLCIDEWLSEKMWVKRYKPLEHPEKTPGTPLCFSDGNFYYFVAEVNWNEVLPCPVENDFSSVFRQPEHACEDGELPEAIAGDANYKIMKCKKKGSGGKISLELHVLHPLPLPPDQLTPLDVMAHLRGCYSQRNWRCREMDVPILGKVVRAATILFTTHPHIDDCDKRGFTEAGVQHPPRPLLRNLGKWVVVDNGKGIVHWQANAELGQVPVVVKAYKRTANYLQGEMKYASFLNCFSTLAVGGNDPGLGVQGPQTATSLAIKNGGTMWSYLFYARQVLAQCPLMSTEPGRRLSVEEVMEKFFKNSQKVVLKKLIATDDPRITNYQVMDDGERAMCRLATGTLRTSFDAEECAEEDCAAEGKRFFEELYKSCESSIMRRNEKPICFQRANVLYLPMGC